MACKFNPKSLLDVCKEKVIDIYYNNWSLTQDLPKSLRLQCLSHCWNRTEYNLPHDCMFNLLESWNPTQDPTTEQFIALMYWDDEEIVPFASEINHVYFSYYKMFTLRRNFGQKHNRIHYLCKDCYDAHCYGFERHQLDRWLEKNIWFSSITKHITIESESIMTIIWEKENWCSLCICKPLFRIYNKYDCIETTKCPSNKYLREGSISTSTDSEEHENVILPRAIYYRQDEQ